MSKVQEFVIKRLNSQWPPMSEDAAREYARTLGKFSDVELRRGMDEVMGRQWQYGRPKPGDVKAVVFEVMPRPEQGIPDNPLDHAKQLIEGRYRIIADHPVLEEVNTLAGKEACKKMLRERALVQAQVICGCRRIGFDSGTAYGYMTWSPNRQDCLRLFNEDHHQAGTGVLNVSAPRRAVDWFRAMEEIAMPKNISFKPQRVEAAE